MISKTLETKLRADPGDRSVVAKISTMSVDRDGDVMMPSGVDLTDFEKNPVVLFGHDQGRIPVGKAEAIHRRTRDIVAKVKFAERPDSLPDLNEWVPDTVFSLFQQGILKAFSVGFTIDDARDATKRDMAKFGPDVRRVITNWKLIEFSVVPVPANQDALAMAISKGQLTKGSWTHNTLELATFDNEAIRLTVDVPSRLVIGGRLP